jgi:SAM-dependent methyltransferase
MRAHRQRVELPPPPALMRWDVLNDLLDTTAERRYLEIGVQNGNCGAKVRDAVKWGVDPEPRAGADRRYDRFFRLKSDDFFARLTPDRLFDVVFVDGLHHAEQTQRDVENALRHLAVGGFVVMHDCNPLTELAQRVPRATGVWNGDCWKTMVRLRQRAEFDAFTVAADHGLGIVRKARNPAPLGHVPGDLSYGVLDRDRDRLLGLVPAADWTERVGPPLALGRVALLSAIFGGRDEPGAVPAGLDVDRRIMFTDGSAFGAGWETIVQAERAVDPRLAARRIKALGLDLVDCDTLVWVDGRVLPTGVPLRPLLRKALLRSDLAGFPHPWRDCAYAEARECAALDLANVGALERQAAAYRKAGLPVGSGLWNTMALARRRTDATVSLGREWWAEIQRHTARDQISFPFLLWKHGLTCAQLGADVYRSGSSRHFERGAHKSAAK